jgi:hypothetical protein
MVKSESEKLLELERAHEIRHQQAQQQSRVALLRKEWADKQAQQLRDVLEAESDLQQQMLALQRASMKEEVQENLTVAAGIDTAGVLSGHGIDRLGSLARVDARAMASAKSEIEQLGDEVLERQRNRFQEMQSELSRQRRNEVARGLERPAEASEYHPRSYHSAKAGEEFEEFYDRPDFEQPSKLGHRHGDTGDRTSPQESKSKGDPRWFASPDVPVPHPRRQRSTAGSKIIPQKAATTSDIDFTNTVKRNSDIRNKYARTWQSVHGKQSDITPSPDNSDHAER